MAACLSVGGNAGGRTVYVSPSGDDGNPGTIDAPIRTLCKAEKMIRPGDSCYLRAGSYNGSIRFKKLRATADKPVLISAYKNETVIFDGTEPVTSEWKKHKGDIYRAKLKKDGWQLFLNNEIMTTARFPDASWGDGSIWDLQASCRHMASNSHPGIMADERPSDRTVPRAVWDEGAEKHKRQLPPDVNAVSLANSGMDVSGAVAVMHIGSWLSWAQRIDKHVPGENTFTYSKNFEKSGKTREPAERLLKNEKFFQRKNIKTGQGYYFIEGLQCLDQPGEWYYTPEDKSLYVMMPDKSDPAGRKLRIKTKDYNLIAVASEHITVKGIRFFGTTFRLINCNNITIEDCRFRYPSFNKLVLGDFRRGPASAIHARKKGDRGRFCFPEVVENSSDNVVRNCTFTRMDGPALEIEGVGNLIENCCFSEIDYTCLGTGGEGTVNLINSRDSIFRRNTIHTTGNSDVVRAGSRSLVEMNHIYNSNLLQHDGAQINVGAMDQKGTVLRRNWLHDSLKAALRFDSAVLSKFKTLDFDTGGTMEYNVAWRTGPLKLKGDKHLAANNTSFDGSGKLGLTLCVLDNPSIGGINTDSVTKNNIAALSGHFGRVLPLPGKSSGNIELSNKNDIRSILRDPDKLDFRPRDASSKAGAYQYDAKNYWIPGRKTDQASTPVPPDESTAVKPDADLMWLGGYKADKHILYFGRKAKAVTKADEKSKLCKGVQASNIFAPGSLTAGESYYWRVDAVSGDQSARGETWKFTVGGK